MSNKALLIMAAGIGSRFGGEKQFISFGPCGESLLDYSIYDALECGFDRIIIVIRHSMRAMVEMRYSELFEKYDIILTEQEADTLPDFFTAPKDRIKPYGTAHAIMSAAAFIDYPTLVINADDFYSRETFVRMSELMDSMDDSQIGLACFPLGNTLSSNGTVTRGLCQIDSDGNLVNITETTEISVQENGVITGKDAVLSPDTPTSMNVWVLMPSFAQNSRPYFEDFFNRLSEDDLRSELPLPVMIDNMLRDKRATVKTLSLCSEWMGVTYAQDMPYVKEKIAALHNEGIYPTPLFE